MKLQDVMAELEGAGSEQTRKTYRRHGVPDPMFGVSFAKLGELRKRLKVDHELAEGLWGTGNADARVLAAMIADPARMTPAALDAWAGEVRGHVLAGYVAELAVAAPDAPATALRWLDDPRELVARAGWNAVAGLVDAAPALPDAWFGALLPRIERGIHAAPNRVKEGMNWTLIAIGARNEALATAAIEAARRIGVVEVDHGDTDCKTPAAEPYILKTRAHREAKAARAAEKAAAKAGGKPAAPKGGKAKAPKAAAGKA